MATVEAESVRRGAAEGRVVVLSDATPPCRSLLESDDLLLESLRSAGLPAELVAVERTPPSLGRRDVCFDALGVWLSDAQAARFATMAQQRRDQGFTWVKFVRGERLPRRFAALPPQRRMAFRCALDAVDELVAASDALRDWLQGEFALRGGVRCISGLLPLPSDDFRRAADALPPPGCGKQVCCPGVFEPDSGFDQAADAVDQLRRASGCEVGLVLLVLGPRRNREFARRVLAERPWITIAEGLGRLEMLCLIQRCDAMVRCARRETWGLLRAEAIRQGTPVVAARACGETRGVRLFDFGSRYQLAAQLRLALESGKQDPDLARWSQFFARVARSNAAELAMIAARRLGRPALRL